MYKCTRDSNSQGWLENDCIGRLQVYERQVKSSARAEKKKKKPQGRHWEYSAKKQAVQNACWKIFLYLFYKQIKYFCILCIFFSCCYLNYKANRSVMLLANKRTVSEITYSIISFSSGLKKHEEMWILTTSFHQKIQHNCS